MRIPLNRGEGTGILVRPAPEHAEEIRAFRRELLESGSAADGTGGFPALKIPWSTSNTAPGQKCGKRRCRGLCRQASFCI
ncbi:MAG: hypothetical protein IKD66_05955 [Solobacterium sp.]|nr:hypothetical protein [Solobacterium sp.]